jgi:hypothetical protein
LKYFGSSGGMSFRYEWSFFLFQIDTREGNTDLPKLDLNVLAAWKMGVTGKGVVVTVLDDGNKN